MSDSTLRERAEQLRERLEQEAESASYHLNPDREHTLMLCEGLIVNQDRYGYQACPCRLAKGCKEDDLDVICPCDYRDPDLNEFGACYCALYVSEDVAKGRKAATSIPERRPPEKKRKRSSPASAAEGTTQVFRCKVCGYLCAREDPPERCPICKAGKDRFERFSLRAGP